MQYTWRSGIHYPTRSTVGRAVRRQVTRTNPDRTTLRGNEYGRCIDAAGARILVEWSERPAEWVFAAECEIGTEVAPPPPFADTGMGVALDRLQAGENARARAEGRRARAMND